LTGKNIAKGEKSRALNTGRKTSAQFHDSLKRQSGVKISEKWKVLV